MEIQDQIRDQMPSIGAFMSFRLPPIFDIEEESLFGSAIEATSDSYDPFQQSTVRSALAYQRDASVLSSPFTYSTGSSNSSGAMSLFASGSSARSFSFFGRSESESSSPVNLFLAPRPSFLLSTPDGPLSVGDLIDFFG